MKISQYLFFLILLTSSFALLAQDKVRFCDGKELKCKVEGRTDTTVWVSKKTKRKTKEEIILSKHIFSLVYGDSNEVVIYKPDASDEKAFTVLQMRSYVEGASFARRNFHPFIPTCGAFIAGAGGGYVGFWGFLIALTYDIGVSSFAPRPKSTRKEKLPEVTDQFFIFGFQDVARKKKTHRIIFGSIAGFVTGAVVHDIIKKPQW